MIRIPCVIFLAVIIIEMNTKLCLGNRNPFEPLSMPPIALRQPVSPQDYHLTQLTLKGVIWGTEKAAALFEADDGQTFRVKVGSKIGENDGKVIKIDDKIVVIQGSFGKKIFTLRGY